MEKFPYPGGFQNKKRKPDVQETHQGRSADD